MPTDVMLIWLGDSVNLQPEGIPASVDVEQSEYIISQKIGYRVVDRKRLRIDALTGFRYWHMGQNLAFSPAILPTVSAAQDWVDPLVGGRIQLTLCSKVSAVIAGDTGGWGTGSQLEYQVAGLLSYRFKPRWTLWAGYRYLDVNYRSTGSVLDIAMPGALVGVSWEVKRQKKT